MNFPKSVTVAGLVIAVASVFVDPANTPWLSALLGDHAATKLAAAGAIIASLGRALLAPAATPPAEPPKP